MQLQHMTPAPYPFHLDGLDGQEDELEDVHNGELEPRPHDDSSGDRPAPRPPRPSPEVEERERSEPIYDEKPRHEVPSESPDDPDPNEEISDPESDDLHRREDQIDRKIHLN